LPDAVEVAAYYLVAEAVTNAVKHADAGLVTVRISVEAKSARIEVADDGVGGTKIEGSSGLRGLADRVAALGGELTVDSPQGAGTRVSATVPVG
jgi:signal transduction histidine kinase